MAEKLKIDALEKAGKLQRAIADKAELDDEREISYRKHRLEKSYHIINLFLLRVYEEAGFLTALKNKWENRFLDNLTHNISTFYA